MSGSWTKGLLHEPGASEKITPAQAVLCEISEKSTHNQLNQRGNQIKKTPRNSREASDYSSSQKPDPVTLS
jgi:hypothetical protein